MSFGIKSKIDEIESRLRTVEIGLKNAELREKQLIIMIKMILDKTTGAHRSKSKTIRIKDIIQYMEQLVNANLTVEEIRESPDLISELIKKGL